MFIDEARIFIKAGNGGDGCSSIYRDRFNRVGSPDGGFGGNGGDVVIEVDRNVQTLLDFQYRQHHEAERGYHGSSNHKKGARGSDLVIKVPPGTIVKDSDTGLIIRDLTRAGDRVIAARGGHGGRGNSRNHEATEGVQGEEKTIVLELKLLADAGIIGYPNAGKSTLISRISSAHPKIASYPFTTKEPVLGVVKIHEDAAFVVAEIPGLIEGAHEGRGLGDKFLKHIERTKVLIHVVDIAAFEGRDPVQDYRKLNFELKAYSKELSKKAQFIALNKIDIPESEARLRKFRKAYPKKKVYPISAVTGKGVKELLEAVYKKVWSMKSHEED
ncbi:MAG: GTPase ObgE [Candidatus Omnitrophica bacterium]|nr:GTPase ObgE [Candidatus Omnitrophota bacterium]